MTDPLHPASTNAVVRSLYNHTNFSVFNKPHTWSEFRRRPSAYSECQNGESSSLTFSSSLHCWADGSAVVGIQWFSFYQKVRRTSIDEKNPWLGKTMGAFCCDKPTIIDGMVYFAFQKVCRTFQSWNFQPKFQPWISSMAFSSSPDIWTSYFSNISTTTPEF